MSARLGSRAALLAGALLIGPIAGALAARKPTITLLLCLAVIGVLALASLGDRAFPWALVFVSVAPWYPFTGSSAEPPILKQLYLCLAIIAAVLIPWLWSLATGARRRPASRIVLLYAVLSLGYIVLVYNSVGGIGAMVQSGTVGFLMGGITFLCARRFADGKAWVSACFAGLALLSLQGALAFAADPGDRVGSFVGHGITYGALVVSMLPAALLFAAKRSRLLVLGTGVVAATMLILSQSRSSWLATMLMVLYVVILLARRGDMRAVFYVTLGLAVALTVILSTGSLRNIVEKRINSQVTQSEAVTHREFSLHYAGSQIRQRPVFGAGRPGYAAEQIGAETDLQAVDNGYLSVAIDLGLLGLLIALVPIGVAIRVLGRALRLGAAPPVDLALALGIMGVAVVTLFYDSFYWAQLDLMMFGMGGVLSARLAAQRALEPIALPRRRFRIAAGRGRFVTD